MDDADRVRVWLVDRTYTDKGLISIEYATVDGDRFIHRQQSLNAPDPAAAIELPAEDLEPVRDPEDRERYRAEATRMAERHDPEDRV